LKRLALWLVLIVGLFVGGIAGYAHAQTRPPFVAGHVFSGDEIGFRIEGMHPGQPSRATLLIKIAGEWHEFQPTMDVTPPAR
jgi:hypothetical protein